MSQFTNDQAMSRRTFLQACAATGMATAASPWAAGQAPAAPRRRRPNILLLTTDQWHYDIFSHRGCSWLNTPHSDRLAERGVSFERAYAADPVCAPARTSWLTGRMPAEHRVIGNGFPVMPDIPDMGQWFGDHGYETAQFGKWHTRGRDPNKSFQHRHGMHPAGQYGDFSVAQMASAYLLGRRSTSPFLLSVDLMNPHDICQVGCFRTGEGELPVDVDELPPLPENYHARPDEPEPVARRVRGSHARSMQAAWNELDVRTYRWMYCRYCEMVDAAVGRVLDALEASGEADNTLVVYTSDHGEGMGHHGLYWKAFLYEESVRVPFIVSFPGHVQSGTRESSIPVSGVDLLPTFCNVAGVPAPPKMCGEDFLEQYRAGRSNREALVASGSFGGHMVRDDRYKLIRYDDDPTTQLFDLQADPQETRNLAGEQLRRVAELWAHWEAFQNRLTPFPVPEGGIGTLWRT